MSIMFAFAPTLLVVVPGFVTLALIHMSEQPDMSMDASSDRTSQA